MVRSEMTLTDREVSAWEGGVWLSWTETLKVENPSAVGVPKSRPSWVRDRPSGSSVANQR